MKKITLLLTLLLCVAGTAWAQFSYNGVALDLSDLTVGESVDVVLKVEGTKADGSALTKYLATNTSDKGKYYNDGLDAISTTNLNFIYTVVKKTATAVALKDAHGNYVPGWADGANGSFTNNRSESDTQQAAHQYTFTGTAASGYTLTSNQGSGAPLKYNNSANRLGVGNENNSTTPCRNITFKFYPASTKRISLAPLARQSALEDGHTYMIYNSANDGYSRAYFLTASDNALVGEQCLNASSFLKKDYEYNLDKYLWTVRKVENVGNEITYTIQNKHTGMYATASGVSGSPEALLIQRWDAETTLIPHNTTANFTAYDHDGTSKGYADINKTLVFTVGKQGTDQQGNPVYTCWNGSGNGAFATWQNGHPISFYTFETNELHYAAFTYNYTLNGDVIGSEQHEVELGQPFPSRSINYVNFTGFPEGNVTAEANDQTYEITSSYTDNFLYKETKTGCLYLPRATRAYLRCKQDDSQTLSKWLPRANKYEEDTKYYTWTIDGNWFSGFTLKNQGTGKYLTASNTNNEGTLNMKSTVSDLAKYDIVYHSNNYFFKIKGTDNCYLSNNGGFNNVEEKALSTWKSNNVLSDNSGRGDDGSKFTFFAMSEIDEATMLSNNKAYMKSRLGNTTIGLYNATADQVDALSTLDACKTFMNERGLDIYPSRYYKIVSVSEPTTVLYENYNSANGATYYLAHGAVSGNQVPYLWKFNLIEGGIYNGKYNIQNANGNYLGEIVWNANSGTYSDASQSVYALSKEFVTATNAVSLRWYRSADAKDGTLERKDDGTLRSWNAENQAKNNWYILPVESIDLDITAAGWASVNLPFAVELPDGLKAYAVTRVEGDVVYGEEITSKIVPANTPVFVAGNEEGTYALTILYDNNEHYTGTNKLYGSTKPEAVGSGAYYGLKANGNGGASLVPYNVTTLPANKAVLPASEVPTEVISGAAALLFDFSGDVTGITPAISVGEKEVFYDLNGRVVAFPSNGVFVKSNGQKVLIK
ncbi:MAG: hypothetical protein PUB53_02920 [Bacteroidales bacterium]|nr:hypothetical protein [Bacteroidales bacterium]